MLAVEYVDLESLAEHPQNARSHNKVNLDAIAASLKEFGQVEPLVVQKHTGYVIGGNGRLQVIRSMGWKRVPVVLLDIDDARAKALGLALNRTAELATWNPEILATLVRELEATDVPMSDLGFSAEMLDELLKNSGKADATADVVEDEAPEPPKVPTTKKGDVWTLGRHRLVCGDCRDEKDVKLLVDGRRVNMAFTSPPYASQRKYDDTSGFQPIAPDDYVDWFDAVQFNVLSVLAEDGSWFVNIKEHCEDGQRHLYVKDLVLAHVRKWKWRFVDELAWTHNGLPGTWDNRFKNQWEPVFHFSPERSIKFRPNAVSSESKYAFKYDGSLKDASTGNPISWSGSSVDHIEGTALPGNVLRIGKSHEAIRHEAMFPVGLPLFFINAFTDSNDVVFDPFIGSGTTLIAAEHAGRIGVGIEISPGYCDVIVERWQNLTGEKAHRSNG